MALYREQPLAVRLLLAAGADVNVCGDEGDSPLRWCAERGWLELAELLLRCGAEATIDTSGGPLGANALGMAAMRLDVDMVKLLLSHGARPTALDADRMTPMEHLAAQFRGSNEHAITGPARSEDQARLAAIQHLLAAAAR